MDSDGHVSRTDVLLYCKNSCNVECKVQPQKWNALMGRVLEYVKKKINVNISVQK